METLSLFNAKTHFSQLIEKIASGAEHEILISRHGVPVARLVPVASIDAAKRIGIAAGLFAVPDDIDAEQCRNSATDDGHKPCASRAAQWLKLVPWVSDPFFPFFHLHKLLTIPRDLAREDPTLAQRNGLKQCHGCLTPFCFLACFPLRPRSKIKQK